MAARSGPDRTGRLAIIAGGGYLPLKVAEAARSAGDEPVIIVLRDEGDRDFSGFDHTVAGIADFAGIQKLIRAKGVKRVVLSGAVRRRPGWRDIRPTWRIVADIPSIVGKLFAGGDDAVLQMVIGLFQGMGCRVVGVHEILPDLLADVGSLGRVMPTPADLRDIDAAAEAAHILGRLDVGQGAVSVGGRVVALEGAEGTDAMLVRVAELRQIGRISRTRRGVLVKMCKPQQDMRVDLPTIGPSTVQAALEAGLAGIAVEAGRALVLERSAVLEMADSAGIFVCGIDLGLPAKGL